MSNYCQILWSNHTRQSWDNLINKCPHSTLLQSYYYAQTMRALKQQGVRHGLILIDGVEAGCVQMHEVSLFNKMIHGLSIDRGPLWFDGFGHVHHIVAFADELNRQFPDRLLRKRRIMFEYFGKKPLVSFENYNKTQKIKNYKTFLVDISHHTDDIRAKLKKNWRNILNKAEKNDLDVDIDLKLSNLAHFLQYYTQDRFQKGYAGASAKFLSVLAKHAAINQDCVIMNASEDNEVIASIMIFIHGGCATYQAGWTTPYGREKGTHHLLLWRAVEYLKTRGVHEFDLGGHSDETEGLYRFKQGLGGQEITLIGSYS